MKNLSENLPKKESTQQNTNAQMKINGFLPVFQTDFAVAYPLDVFGLYKWEKSEA